MYLDNPLKPIVDLWLQKIQVAKQFKEERFGKFARECHRFYNHSHNWMWLENLSAQDGGFLSDGAFGASGKPTFLVQINKVFEAVALYGPALFHQYPEVVVDTVRRPEIPPQMLGIDASSPYGAQVAQQFAYGQHMEYLARQTYGGLKRHYLNWLQIETNKKDHSRLAITEGVVKGLGLLRTEMFAPPGSRIRYPRSVYMSCDDLLKDPDATYDEDVQWIAIRNVQPVNKVEERFGHPSGTLKGHMQSLESQAAMRAASANGDLYGSNNASHDLIEYWEIYSKNGFGDRLRTNSHRLIHTDIDASVFGDFAYIVVANGVPFPLNLPTAVIGREDPRVTYLRAQWPIPFWADIGCGNGWPVSELAFYRDPNSVWPISLIQPAIGEIRFVNWCMSFLADKVASSCTTYLGVLKDAAEDIRRQLESPSSPYRMIEISRLAGKSINEIISFIQAPEFPQHIWAMIAHVMEIIDKKTGLTELLHGLTSRQMRSATEADVRQQNIQIRPDDMATRVEDWLAQTAMKEAEAACWLNRYEDWEGPLGPQAAQVMVQYTESQDFDRVVRDYDYRIAADSARKPNKAQKLQNLYELGQVALPTIQQFAMAGMVAPWNAFMEDVCELLNLDPRRYQVQLPSPQEQGPSEEERKAQAREQQRLIELQYLQLKSDLEVQQMQQTNAEELAHRIAMNEEELQSVRQKLAIAQQHARQAA
jgi:hypothetical protein